jgi:hypothetical protein
MNTFPIWKSLKQGGRRFAGTGFPTRLRKRSAGWTLPPKEKAATPALNKHELLVQQPLRLRIQTGKTPDNLLGESSCYLICVKLFFASTRASLHGHLVREAFHCCLKGVRLRKGAFPALPENCCGHREAIPGEMETCRRRLETLRELLGGVQVLIWPRHHQLEACRPKKETRRVELWTRRDEMETRRGHLKSRRGEIETRRDVLESSCRRRVSCREHFEAVRDVSGGLPGHLRHLTKAHGKGRATQGEQVIFSLTSPNPLPSLRERSGESKRRERRRAVVWEVRVVF